MITRRRRRSISPVLDSHDKTAATSSADRTNVDSETSSSARYSTFARPDRPNYRHSNPNAGATSLPGLVLFPDSSDSTLFSDRRLTSPSNKQALDFFSLDSIEEDLDSQQSRSLSDDSYQRSEVGFQGPLRRRRRRPYFGKNRIRAVGPLAFSFHGSNNQFHGPSSGRFPPQIVNPFQPQYHQPSEEVPRQKESKNKIPSSFSSLSSGSPFSHFLISHNNKSGPQVSVPSSDRPKPMPQAINPFDGRQPVHEYSLPDDDRPEFVDRPRYFDRPAYVERPEYVDRPEHVGRPEYVDRPAHVDRPSYEERSPYVDRPTYIERPTYKKRPVLKERPSYEERRPLYQSSQHERPASQQKGEYLPKPSYEADRNRDKQLEDDRNSELYVPYSSPNSRITTPPPIQPNPTRYTVGYQNHNSQEQQSPEEDIQKFQAPFSSPKRHPGPAITHTPPPRSEEYNRPPYAPPQFSRPSKGDEGFLLPTPGTTFHEELEFPLILYDDDEEDKTGGESYSSNQTDEPRPYHPVSYEQEPVTRPIHDENVYYKTSAERHPIRQPSYSVERPISPPIGAYRKQSPELSYENPGLPPTPPNHYYSVQQDENTPGPSYESTESTPVVRNRKPSRPSRNRRPELVSEEQESVPSPTEYPSVERITEAPRRPTRPKIHVPIRSHRTKTPTETTTPPSTTRAPPFKPFSMPPFKKPISVRERGGSRHKTTLAAKPIHIPGTARHPDFSKLSAADDSSSSGDSDFSTSDQRQTQDKRPNSRYYLQQSTSLE